MEAMAIAAGSRIRISIEHSLAMSAFSVTIIGVAGCTFLNDSHFFPLPRSHLVNVFMAVFTLNFIDEMGAGIMFYPFFFMASMAGDLLGMNSSPFSFLMGFDIRNIPVATVARVGSMNGLGKFPFADIRMAT
jgi:hypothetical protein